MITDAQIDAFFDYGASPYAARRLPDKVKHEVVRLTNDDWREVTPNDDGIEQVGVFDNDKAAETARRRLHVRWILEQTAEPDRAAGYRTALEVLQDVLDPECQCVDPPEDRADDDERGNDPQDPSAHSGYCPKYLEGVIDAALNHKPLPG